jgi:hypothetical protein
MKIAICLSGLTKSHECSLLSIERYFKDHDVDIFCQTYTFKDLNTIIRDTWSKESTKEYYGNLKSPIEDILKLFNPKDTLIIDYDSISQHFGMMFIEIMSLKNIVNYYIDNNKTMGMTGNLSMLSMFFSMITVNDLRKEYEKNNNIKYDVVIRMRYDSSIFRMGDIENYDLTKLNIPFGTDNEGINDQFAFGPSDLMDIYMSAFPETINLARQCLKNKAEPLLLTHLTNHDMISRINRPDITVAISSLSRPAQK